MTTHEHVPNRRRFGWYRPRPNGTFDTSIVARPLDAATWTEFREFTRVVEYLRPYMVDHLALSADYDAVRAAETEIGKMLTARLATGMIDVPAGVEANAAAQRRIGNFLSAASAFRDRCAARLATEFGRDSEEASAFKAATSHWFDTSFAYRCVGQLRNFAQHHELPISFVPINADRDADGMMAARIELQLYPATLAASGRINAKVRAELRALGDGPLDLAPLAADYARAHDGLMALILDIYAPRLEAMAHYAAAIYRTFEVPHDAVPVVWEGDGAKGGPAAQDRMIMMGFDEMLRAFELGKKLNTNAAV